MLNVLAPPRLQKVSANRARGLDQEKKAPTVCRSCLSRGLEITAMAVLFNHTETDCQKYLVLELSRGGCGSASPDEQGCGYANSTLQEVSLARTSRSSLCIIAPTAYHIDSCWRDPKIKHRASSNNDT